MRVSNFPCVMIGNTCVGGTCRSAISSDERFRLDCEDSGETKRITCVVERCNAYLSFSLSLCLFLLPCLTCICLPVCLSVCLLVCLSVTIDLIRTRNKSVASAVEMLEEIAILIPDRKVVLPCCSNRSIVLLLIHMRSVDERTTAAAENLEGQNHSYCSCRRIFAPDH